MAAQRTGPFGEMFHVEQLMLTVNASQGVDSTVLYLDAAYDQTPEMRVLGCPVGTQASDFSLAYTGGATPNIAVSASAGAFDGSGSKARYSNGVKFAVVVHAHAKLVT